MAKLDTTKIPNFDTLSDEVKTVLSAFEIDDKPFDLTGYVKKEVFDAKAKEAAEHSRKLKERMTEDEKKEEERAARELERDALLESLKKDKTTSELKAKYLGLGYDEALASDTAAAYASGDMEKVFANQSTFIENVRKAERATKIAGDPKPPAGSGKTLAPKEKLIEQYETAVKTGNHVLAMSLLEQIKNTKQE